MHGMVCSSTRFQWLVQIHSIGSKLNFNSAVVDVSFGPPVYLTLINNFNSFSHDNTIKPELFMKYWGDKILHSIY